MSVALASLMLLQQLMPTAWDTPPGYDLPPVPEEAVEPTSDTPAADPLTPRQYLYASYPHIAPRMDCVIARESKWTPSARNPRSGASGLAQFLASTWRITPPGRAGHSVFDPYANIDGAAWLATNVGWRQWTVVQIGFC